MEVKIPTLAAKSAARTGHPDFSLVSVGHPALRTFPPLGRPTEQQMRRKIHAQRHRD